MGFSYVGRRLACDMCGKAGGCRKVRCPFGSCPSVAVCPRCRKTRDVRLTKAYHRDHLGCERFAAHCAAEDAKREALLDAGKYLRVSAYGPTGDVKVWFRNKAGDEKALLVPSAVYAAIKLGAPATIEDYEALAGHPLAAAA